MPLMMDVFEEHLEEAAWLWTRWEHALVAPDFDLAGTAELEERLLAHLDGLVEGGAPVAEALLWPELESSEEPSRVCVVTSALLARLEPEGVRTLVRGASPGQREAVQRALELCDRAQLGAELSPLLSMEDGELRARALETLVSRGDVSGPVLSDFLSSDDARVRMAALRGAGEQPGPVLRQRVQHALASAHPGIRAAAIELGLAVGIHEAWSCCRRELEAGGEHTGALLVLWALGCSESELKLLTAMLSAPERRLGALWALGFSGWIPAADACLEWMGDEDMDVARLAGEAFSAISGLRLEGDSTRPPKERAEEPVPLSQEDLDADLVPGPEDDLPLPAVEHIARWWHEARDGFDPRARYLMGHPLQTEVLLAALERGPMRRRHVLAKELTLRSGRALVVPTRAPTRRQRAVLARARTAAPHLRAGWR